MVHLSTKTRIPLLSLSLSLYIYIYIYIDEMYGEFNLQFLRVLNCRSILILQKDKFKKISVEQTASSKNQQQLNLLLFEIQYIT